MLLLIVHIVAGSLALFGGYTALFAGKGGTLHRRGGLAFAWAMLVMTATGAVLAAYKPERGSVVAGVVTFYLVASGVLAVTRPAPSRRMLALVSAFGAAGVAYALALCVAAANGNGRIDSLPMPPIAMFAAIGALGVGLDVRLLLGAELAGAHRIARHLWRLLYALAIAAMSFFLGQADEFPAALRIWPVMVLPPLLPLLALPWFLWRTLRRRRAAAPPVAVPANGEFAG